MHRLVLLAMAYVGVMVSSSPLCFAAVEKKHLKLEDSTVYEVQRQMGIEPELQIRMATIPIRSETLISNSSYTASIVLPEAAYEDNTPWYKMPHNYEFATKLWWIVFVANERAKKGEDTEDLRKLLYQTLLEIAHRDRIKPEKPLLEPQE